MAESTLHMKFPRTRHILNLGAATRDDLIVEAHEALIILQNSGLTVEEKVDGANLGVSINPDAKKLVFQKRGHVIAVNSEPQYAKLQAWGDKYEQQLYHVLGYNKILFGEWMCAKHTISYDQLPDWFLAFDVYDKKSAGHFLSRADRDTLLSATGIPVIKAVHEGPLTSLGSLVDLLMGTKSAYCTGAVQAEGLYLRVDSGSQLECRAKIVHPDFTQALSEVGGHWTKKSIQYNRIRPDLWKQDDESNSDGPSCCGSEDTPVMTQQGIFLGIMCSGASGATTTTTTTTCPPSMPTSGSSVQQQYSVDESQVVASNSNCSLITSPPAAAAAASKLTQITQTKNLGLRSSNAAGNTAVHVPVIDSRSTTTIKRTASTTATSWSNESDREHGCHAAAQKLQGMVPDNALAKRMEQFGEAHHITLLDPAELSNLLQTHRGCTPPSLSSHYNRQQGDVSDVDGAVLAPDSTTVKHLSDSNDDWKAALRRSTKHNSTSA
ncbi:hypothetical protein CEUSTIGMA_g6204.t1 [Chlamydomonas eustigma]|uniref:RNA ligase domain-containing protein n=1 Tax=Chlamydomonas eustigma TaxID=1157962 RepID=A0A250X6S1_9CHLO|nr:hypothetical protein CEUSTIGMA_g6204.t1 [Chlamydomonas eustigma]|eukprot:GAX78767.1 hypothetical protein CEUSTIGMA_g6204.t1 [Chlamydomonas eustigma]